MEPEQPSELKARGLSFLMKAHQNEVEGMTSLVPGLSGIAERLRSVFSHLCLGLPLPATLRGFGLLVV